MPDTLCRNRLCRARIPYNTLTYHGFCEKCWREHELGRLALDDCHCVTVNGMIQHRNSYRHAGLPEKRLDHDAYEQIMNSPTWVSVVDFARRMEKKLSLHRDRGNRECWLAMSPEWLFIRAMEEAGEAASLMKTEHGEREANWAELLADECADAANLLMMLADKALYDYLRDKDSK